MSDDAGVLPNRLPRVTRAIAEHPWAILPSTLETICELVAARSRGVEFTPEEIQARIGAGPAQRPAVVSGAIGVVPLYGVLFPRANLVTEMSGGTSLQQWAQDFEGAIADPNVSAVLIDVHSPGGSTFLVPETAARIRAARGKKPIVAIANTTCASGAYYLAAQADEVVVTPSALIGSIGVYLVHQDWSKALDAAGIDVTYISAGKFKTEGNPEEPLSETARDHMQEVVDAAYSKFVGDVAKGRGVRVSEVRNGFGQGRVVHAELAVELGMADRVDTFEKTIARLAAGKVAMRSPRAEAELAEPTAGLLDLEAVAALPHASSELDEELAPVLASLRELNADRRAQIEAGPVRQALLALKDSMRPPTEATT